VTGTLRPLVFRVFSTGADDRLSSGQITRVIGPVTDGVIKLVPCIPQNFASVAIKMGCRQGVGEGASPNGAVTEPQRSRQPIFIATQRAGALFRFFRVARSGNIHEDIAARSRLEKSKHRLRQMRSFERYRAQGTSVLSVLSVQA